MGTHARSVRALEQAAVDRAICGVFVALALAERFGVSMSLVQRSFAAIVTALQWLDDLDDWSADFLAGRPNLFVAQLRNAPVSLAAEPSHGEVIRMGIDCIERRVYGLLDDAIALQGQIAASGLTDQLLELRVSARDAFERHRASWADLEEAPVER